MELDITQQQFAEVVGTPTTAAAELYNRVRPWFAPTIQDLQDLINYKVADLPNDDDEMKAAAVAYVCLTSFWSAAPSIDLVWTPTGFGIVSNNTLAPASRERVDALRTELHDRAIRAKFDLLDAAYRHPEYATAQPDAPFVVLPSQYRRVTGDNITDTDFDKLVGKIKYAERRLRRLISAAEVDHLRSTFHESLANASAITPVQADVVKLVQQFCIAAANQLTHADSFLADILQIVNDEANAADFPEYIQSSEYIANNSEPYENSVDKPTFFFC